MPSLNDLIAFLPQKPPFLFIDALTHVEYLHSVEGSKTFPHGDRVFENHLPGRPLVPGVILIEALAQISGIILIPSEGRKALGYLAGVKDLRFRRLIHPDEKIVLSSRLEQRFGSAASFEVRAEVDGETAASGLVTLGGMTWDLEPKEAPADPPEPTPRVDGK